MKSLSLLLVLAMSVQVAQADWRFSTVTGASGVPLNVVEVGTPGNPGILFVHGFSQSALSWEAQLDNANLQRNFHLVAIDLRGHGNSGKPWRPEDYSTEAWAQDIAAVIEATGIKRPVIVAWSFGGGVVMDYLRVHGRAKVAGLQLVGSAGWLVQPPTDRAPPDPDWVSDMLSNDLRANIRAAEQGVRRLTADEMPAAWVERTVRANLLMPVYAKKAIGIREVDNSDLAAELELPVLLSGGELDQIVTPAMLTAAAALLPQASVRVYPGIGHAPFAEAPDEFNRDLVQLVAAANASMTPGTVFSDCDGCPSMIVIPAGDFLMGSNDGTEARPEGPIHKVTIKRPFALGRYEVTNAQFGAFIADTGYEPADRCNLFFPEKMELRRVPGVTWRDPAYGRPPADNEPVTCIDWNDATAYVNWLAQKTGQTYRLPSEAEWEYVARAGATTAYPWGDDGEGACPYANVYDASAINPLFPWDALRCNDGFSGVSQIGQLQPNAFGAHDMVGNVWEWVQDCYVMPYPEESVDEMPIEVEDCDRRVVRGGSWRTSIGWTRVSFRGRDPAELASQIFGLRVARDL